MSFLDDSDRSKLGRQRRRNGLYRVQEQISRPIKGSAAICSCLCSMIEFRFWWLLGSELTELKVVSKEGVSRQDYDLSDKPSKTMEISVSSYVTKCTRLHLPLLAMQEFLERNPLLQIRLPIFPASYWQRKSMLGQLMMFGVELFFPSEGLKNADSDSVSGFRIHLEVAESHRWRQRNG
ncbi:hypothetical protein PI125_g3881 [Phytophthora idaei]|nr:hypothetical protein PI125_g3881 [Phytophthora idaei]